MKLINTVFVNTNFVDEAANYAFYDIFDRDTIEDDIKECLKEYDADEEDIQEYTNKIMSCLEDMKPSED